MRNTLILIKIKHLLPCLLLMITAMETQGGQGLTAISPPVPAPDFKLMDIDGKSYRLSDYRGKVVLVNFWATWCPPCRREMPSMQRAWEKLKDEDFVILAVDIGEDEETIFGFIFSTGVELTFPILLDEQGEVIKAWPVRGLPTSFLVDRQGRMVARAVGGREWDDPELLAGIKELISGKNKPGPR